jgi:hypothetical protein
MTMTTTEQKIQNLEDQIEIIRLVPGSNVVIAAAEIDKRQAQITKLRAEQSAERIWKAPRLTAADLLFMAEGPSRNYEEGFQEAY